MSLLDTYRNTVSRKQGELSRLMEAQGKEQSKAAEYQRKVNQAKEAASRSKSPSTINSKIREAERYGKTATDAVKKVADIGKKIAQKQKEIYTEQRRFQQEEKREYKREIDKKAHEMQTIQHDISSLEYRQSKAELDIETLKALPEKITVLFLAASPKNVTQLRLDEEAREIREKIRLSEHRDAVQLETRWATRSMDILQAINELNPTVVHFSGHGSEDGCLVLGDSPGNAKLVSIRSITETMNTATDCLRLIVLNACHSKEQAESASQCLEAAIGMRDMVDDTTAIVFAAQLYSAIGVGKSIKRAFEQACAVVCLEDESQADIPQLFIMDGLDANEIILVKPPQTH